MSTLDSNFENQFDTKWVSGSFKLSLGMLLDKYLVNSKDENMFDEQM